MTPSTNQTNNNNRKRRILIADLILGMWSSIINAPEIKKLYPYKQRKKFNRRRIQIVECASAKFLNIHNGYRLLRMGNKEGVHNCIISSVKACL